MDDSKIKPAHYRNGDIEVIDYIEDQGFNFNLGNVIKYVSRAGYKQGEDKMTDLSKAMYYLRREIQFLEIEQKRLIAKDDRLTSISS